MVQVTAKLVKELREMTGAGPLDCKKALEEYDGDVDKAADYLREKGIAKAKKKLGKGRTMTEGVVEIYQHFNKRIGVIVEVNCETDFVAATPAFQGFAKDVALHISSSRPLYINRADVPEAMVAAERDIQLRRAIDEGKPQEIAEKIVEGRINKWFQEIVLMEQEFLKDDSKTIAQLLEETVSEIGESVQIGRFALFNLGEYGDEDNAEDDE